MWEQNEKWNLKRHFDSTENGRKTSISEVEIWTIYTDLHIYKSPKADELLSPLRHHLTGDPTRPSQPTADDIQPGQTFRFFFLQRWMIHLY